MDELRWLGCCKVILLCVLTLRVCIDVVDTAIVSAVLFRAFLSRTVGAVKKRADLAPIDLAREEYIASRYKAAGIQELAVPVLMACKK